MIEFVIAYLLVGSLFMFDNLINQKKYFDREISLDKRPYRLFFIRDLFFKARKTQFYTGLIFPIFILAFFVFLGGVFFIRCALVFLLFFLAIYLMYYVGEEYRRLVNKEYDMKIGFREFQSGVDWIKGSLNTRFLWGYWAPVVLICLIDFVYLYLK